MNRILLWVVLAVAFVFPSVAVPKVLAPVTRMVIAVEGRGEIVVRLETEKAPRATAQIIRLVEQGFYDGQRWFRVVREPRPFLIQTGDPGSRTEPMNSPRLGQGGTGTRVPFEESGLVNDAGAVGLSTMPGDRDSGDSQFYILLGAARFLDGQYTVFGQVERGMDVVQAIQLGDRIGSVRITRG